MDEREFLERFYDLLDGIAPESEEDVNEHLRELGYDPDKLAQDARVLFRDALEKSPLNPKNNGEVG